MPTRSIKLKVIIPRQDAPEATALRRALWATHAFVNDCVASYERLLLELRQGDVLERVGAGQEAITPAAEWQQRLRERLMAKGLQPTAADEALPHLRGLYEHIVKSSVDPGKGSAEDGRSYHGALVDPESVAGQARRAKSDLLAPLAGRLDAPEEEFRSAALALVAEAGPAILEGTGAPPAWVRQYKSGEERWSETLRRYLRAQQQTGDPLAWLQQAAVLPLATPFGTGRISGSDRLTPYERMALALAVAHLNSWESWSDRARKQHAKRQEAVEGWESQHGEPLREALHAVRAWEQRRAQELKEVAFWTERSVYRLRPRELRGWDRLREWVREHPSASAEDRLAYVRRLQTDLGREFGSEPALRWLAEPAQQWLAEHSHGDAVTLIAAYNARLGILERTKPLPLFTPAHAQTHPRFALFDPPNNSNNPNFTLRSASAGRLTVDIALLSPTEDGTLERRAFALQLAPSDQLPEAKLRSGSELNRAPKAQILEFLAQDRRDTLRAQVGGSNLVFDRVSVAAADRAALEAGNIGSVYLKLALDVDADDALLRARRKVAYWLRSSLGERFKKVESRPGDGFSVLSVDLGLRSAAAISVFRLSSQGGDGPWPVEPVTNLSIAHERTALLKLPGEDPGRKERARREEAWQRLAGIRASLYHLRLLRRACVSTDPGERREALQALHDMRAGRATVLVDEATVARLLGIAEAGAEEWSCAAGDAYVAYERALGLAIRDWRRETRSRGIEGLGGKSAWQIEYLERVRRVLQQWHRHQRPGADQDRHGTVASRLLSHINNLKDDRIKTTADLIVQAARGLVYHGGHWRKSHEPVDVIVMEDLSRYLFATDRPPSENRLLMRWAHRQLLSAVKLQAELYAIEVADTSASFSSRYDAVTRAPGVRCRAAGRSEMGILGAEPDGAFAGRLRRLGIDPGRVHEGDLLPLGDGELLASAAPGGGLRVVHADLNAAQNIGLRFLEGHREPIRLPARRIPGAPARYLNAGLGKRLQGALGGTVAVLEPVAESEVLFRLRAYASAKQAAKVLGVTVAASADLEEAIATEGAGTDEELELAASLALEQEAGSERATFFRDPSGGVHQGMWVPGVFFWKRVRDVVTEALRSAGRLHG